jgi:hypothetical protein
VFLLSSCFSSMTLSSIGKHRSNPQVTGELQWTIRATFLQLSSPRSVFPVRAGTRANWLL